MILCPKCKFEQPEDVYCAKCGVNMTSYKRSGFGPKPILILSVTAGVVLFGWLVTQFSKSLSSYETKMSESQKVYEDYNRESPEHPQTPTRTNSIAKFKQQKSDPLPSLYKKESPKTSATPMSFAEAKLAAAATAAPTPTTEPSPQAAPAEKITNQISVQYYLISKESVEKARLAIGRTSSNNVPKNVFESISRDSFSQSLGSENHNLNINQPVSFSQMSQEPRTRGFIGFLIQVTATRISDTQGDYKLAIKRSLPEVSPTGELVITATDFAESVSISAGQVFAISGLLPRKNLLENEDMLYRGNVLRPLVDPGFQKYDQEFVLFLIP